MVPQDKMQQRGPSRAAPYASRIEAYRRVTVGRPRKYADNKERQKAYRNRKRIVTNNVTRKGIVTKEEWGARFTFPKSGGAE